MLGLSTVLILIATVLALMLAGYVALKPQPGRGLAVALLLLFALQAGTLGLRLIDPGLSPMLWRVVTGAALPGLIFLFFARSAADAGPWRWRHAGHVLPVALVAVLAAWPAAGWRLDATLLLICAGYALALLSSDRRDDNSALRRTARLVAAGFLLALVVVDAALAIELSLGAGLAGAWSLPAAATLLLAVALGLFVWAWRDPEWLSRVRDALADAFEPAGEVAKEERAPPVPESEIGAEARALCDRLDRLLREQRVYAEFGIDLGKLARRLQVPARQLSAAVNQVHGRGLRTLLNDWKVDDAVRQLRDPALRDKPITEVMFDAGFQTKSNFNKEFALRQGVSPSAFRQQA